MSELESHAAAIAEQFSDHLDITQADVEERLETLVEEYRVPLDEARRSVESQYLDEADLEREELGSGDSELVQLGDIDEDEQWIDLRVKVADLWEPGHESIAQVGLLGDESGTMKFVAFDTSDLPELDEGASYALSNIVT
ncbi:MAG: replication factor A, partial [Halolamina sp.]